MAKNINGFRLNKNGKPIINEEGNKRHLTYKGASYKNSDNGTYYFFLRKQNGYFIYNT